MGSIQDIIGGVGNMFGAKPKKSGDFWDRMQGHPLEREETYNRIKDREAGRNVGEYKGKKGGTDLYVGQQMADEATRQYMKKEGFDIDTLDAKETARARAAAHALDIRNRAEAGFGEAYQNDPSEFLRNYGDEMLANSRTGRTTAKYANTLAETLPEFGTKPGRETQAARAAYSQSTAETNAADAAAQIARAQLPYAERIARLNAELKAAQIAAETGGETRLMQLLPSQQALLDAQAKYFGSGSAQREDTLGMPRSLGGGAYYTTDPQTGKPIIHNVNPFLEKWAREHPGGSGIPLPPVGPGSEPPSVGNPPPFDVDKMKAAIENRAREIEARRRGTNTAR